jgi:glyoxylase-like metal-dependent hydrolase (beta-lactamase superfamily II)
MLSKPIASAALVGLSLALAGCDLRGYVIDRTVREQVHYIPDTEHLGGSELTRISEHVYTFRWTWDRSLVVKTDEGFVVTDPYSVEGAKALGAALAKEAPGVPVKTMIYSHYHLDHVVGGASLRPTEVIAHKNCPDYWKETAGYPGVADVLAPTKLVEGDQTLNIGGVELDMIYLGHAHTDTLYAFYLPKERVLHTVDVGLIKTLYPIGGPDMYMPGMIRAMEKLSKLDFDVWLPSHFEYGKKQDFLEALEFTTTTRDLARSAFAKYGVPGDEDTFDAAFHAIYDPLKTKYGQYRGFDQQALFLVSRAYSGAVLGY